MKYDELFARTPADPANVENYAALVKLYLDARDWFAVADMDEPRFDEWDRSVQALLKPNELAFFTSPYSSLDMEKAVFRSISRMNHLTKILVHRQGIKTTNGFNG